MRSTLTTVLLILVLMVPALIWPMTTNVTVRSSGQAKTVTPSWTPAIPIPVITVRHAQPPQTSQTSPATVLKDLLVATAVKTMTNARPLSVILRVPVSTRMARTSACAPEATLVVSASPTSTTVSPLPVRTGEHATIRSLTTPVSVLLGLVATIARMISMSAPQTLVSMERCVMTMSTPTPVPVNLATVAPTVMSTIMTVQKAHV